MDDLVVATAIYRMWTFWRLQMLAMFSLFTVVGVVGLVAAISTKSGPPTIFVVLWLFALVWNGYWFFLRVAYQLELTGNELRWRAPFRSGVVPLDQLVAMRPHRFGSSIEVLELREGSKVLVMVRKGFADFAAEVQVAAPQVRVRVGVLARVGERLPGPRGYRR